MKYMEALLVDWRKQLLGKVATKLLDTGDCRQAIILTCSNNTLP